VCVSLVGGAAFSWQEQLICACKRAGVKRVILSEYGFPNDMPQLDGLPIFEECRCIVRVTQKEGIRYVALAIGGLFNPIFTRFWC
jgi:hypothetical protein